MAGVLFANLNRFVSPSMLSRQMSGELIVLIILGGTARLFGPVAGAFFIITLENYLTTMGQWVFVVQGMIFVICVLLFRRGMVGELARLLRIKL